MRDGAALRARFSALTDLLRRHRGLWAPRPFVTLEPAWVRHHPEVARWLRGLPPGRLEALEDGGVADDAPEAFLAWDREARALSAVPSLAPRAPDPPRPRSVPLRKWSQVSAFVTAAAARRPATAGHAVDWCAGKGHLGRALFARTGVPVTCVERQLGLCVRGARLAEDEGAAGCTFRAADVLADEVPELNEAAFGVALHACGNLWRTLLQRGADAGAPAVAVAPCCYHHLGGARAYAPLSEAGRAADLPLSQHELRLPTAELVVARPSLRAARRREQVFRLGLDLLLREGTGEDRYHARGRFPRAVLDLPFADFCRRAADRLDLPLPPRWDPEAALARGEARKREVDALTRVRALFRRPLELWLVLDAALRELERGRRVEIGTFCPRPFTPRNLLLTSTRTPSRAEARPRIDATSGSDIR